MNTYLFYRQDEKTGKSFFYPVQIEHESQVPDHVHCNPGTLKVEDLSGRVVWSPEKNN